MKGRPAKITRNYFKSYFIHSGSHHHFLQNMLWRLIHLNISRFSPLYLMSDIINNLRVILELRQLHERFFLFR